MIVWLASYPKSGNTWVRLFLNCLLYSKNCSVDINKVYIRQFPLRKDFDQITNNIDNVDDFIKNSLYSQTKINLDNKIKIFKTHNAFWKSGNFNFTDIKNTLGVVYIVRDPRNVITSVKNHYLFESYQKSYDFMTNDRQIIGAKDDPKFEIDLPTIISSWKNHYNSWKKLKVNYLLIKYENLLKKPLEEFTKIVNFLNLYSELNIKKENMEDCIKNCDFLKLQSQEKRNGFIESPVDKFGNSIKFFNLGNKNNWKQLAEKEIAAKLEENFKDEMKELGYL